MGEPEINKPKIIKFGNQFERLGNKVFDILYAIQKLKTNNISINQIDYKYPEFLNELQKVFTFKFGYYKNQDLFIPANRTFVENFNVKDKDRPIKLLKEKINYEYLDTLEYPYDLNDYSLVNLRFGDISGYKIHGFGMNYIDFLDIISEKYELSLLNHDIIVMSDNLFESMQVIKKSKFNKFFNRLKFYHKNAYYDFNLLLNAKLILGSPSSFTLTGHLLNRHNCLGVFKYPLFRPQKDVYQKNYMVERVNMTYYIADNIDKIFIK